MMLVRFDGCKSLPDWNQDIPTAPSSLHYLTSTSNTPTLSIDASFFKKKQIHREGHVCNSMIATLLASRSAAASLSFCAAAAAASALACSRAAPCSAMKAAFSSADLGLNASLLIEGFSPPPPPPKLGRVMPLFPAAFCFSTFFFSP